VYSPKARPFGSVEKMRISLSWRGALIYHLPSNSGF
jgi:hypothetical protein